MQEWIIDGAAAESRADVFLASAMNVSRAEAQRLLESGDARINGTSAKANHRLRSGDRVQAERREAKPIEITPESIPLPIVYEDSDLIVIDKPRGMVVHPAPGASSGTLVHAILAHADDLSGIGGELRPGIVHRLDKDTTGLLVIAKNDAAHIALQKQIQNRTAERIYQAILWGVPGFQRAEIDAPIGRRPGDRKKMAVITDSRHPSRAALTEVTLLDSLRHFSFVEARLKTGRTHQIRVHCAYIGHPVVGDPIYGGLRKVPTQGLTTEHRSRIESEIHALGGQALHAYSLSFDHPRTGERMAFSAPVPQPMRSLLDTIEAAQDPGVDR